MTDGFPCIGRRWEKSGSIGNLCWGESLLFMSASKIMRGQWHENLSSEVNSEAGKSGKTRESPGCHVVQVCVALFDAPFKFPGDELMQ